MWDVTHEGAVAERKAKNAILWSMQEAIRQGYVTYEELMLITREHLKCAANQDARVQGDLCAWSTLAKTLLVGMAIVGKEEFHKLVEELR